MRGGGGCPLPFPAGRARGRLLAALRASLILPLRLPRIGRCARRSGRRRPGAVHAAGAGRRCGRSAAHAGRKRAGRAGNTIETRDSRAGHIRPARKARIDKPGEAAGTGGTASSAARRPASGTASSARRGDRSRSHRHATEGRAAAHRRARDEALHQIGNLLRQVGVLGIFRPNATFRLLSD